jgi:hypothetical protein
MSPHAEKFMQIRLTPLALLLLLPGLAVAAEPPRVEYRFVELQHTADSDLRHFSGGALNENGQAAWLALYNDGLCFGGNCGVFVGDGGTPTQIVTTVGTDYVFLDEPDINDAGDVVFHGAQSVDPGNPEADIYKGIYLWEPGSGLERILRVDDWVPDVDYDVPLAAFNSSPKINNSGLILVPTEIANDIPVVGGVGFFDRIAVYERATHDLHWLYEGAWFSNVPPETWDYAEFIWEAHLNDDNEILTFGVAIPAGGGSPDMFKGAWLKGGVDPVSPFDPLPLVDIANNTTHLAEVGYNPWFSEGGHVLYKAKVSGADMHEGIYLNDGGTVTTVVYPNDPDFSFTVTLPGGRVIQTHGGMVMNAAPEVAFGASMPEHSTALLLWNPTDLMRRVPLGQDGDPPLLDPSGVELRPGVGLSSFQLLDIDESGNLLLNLLFEDLREMIVIGSPAPAAPPLVETGEYRLLTGTIVSCDGPSCTLLLDLGMPGAHAATISADPTGSTAEIDFSLELPQGSSWLPETFSVSGTIEETAEGASINAFGTVGEVPDQIDIQLIFSFPPTGVDPGPKLDLFEAGGVAFHPSGASCEFNLVRGQLVPEPTVALLQVGAFICLALLRRLKTR